MLSKEKCCSSKASDLIIRGKSFDKKQDKSLGKHILERLAIHGDAVAQIFSTTGETNTYAEIRAWSINLAIEMRKQGIGYGDVVSICSYNHPKVCLPLLSTLYLGGIVAPLDPSLDVFDLKHLMSISRPKTIFTEASCVAKLEEAIASLGLDTKLIVFGNEYKGAHMGFDELFNAKNDIESFKPIEFEDPHDHLAFIMSSSGTTGLPKGVAISHGNFMMSLQIIEIDAFKGVKILNMSSLFWFTGIMVTLGALDGGLVRVITPGFDAEHTLKVIEEQKIIWVVIGVTYFGMVVTYENASKYNLSSVKSFSIVGAKASETLMSRGKELFKSAQFMSGYGLTESSGGVFDMLEAKPDSLGKVNTGLEVKIIDPDTGDLLGPNQKGELCVKGKMVFKGYYNNPKATAETIDEDNWLHTGDMCWYDEEKCFYIEGRIKELFKCRGWQISPLEVENVLQQHPDVMDVAVIGVPHDIDVARPRAYIVRRDGSNITEDDIHTYMKQKMNPNKQLFGGIVFLDELPLTPSGKVKRRALHEMARQTQQSS